jgi:hypothetical protein
MYSQGAGTWPRIVFGGRLPVSGSHRVTRLVLSDFRSAWRLPDRLQVRRSEVIADRQEWDAVSFASARAKQSPKCRPAGVTPLPPSGVGTRDRAAAGVTGETVKPSPSISLRISWPDGLHQEARQQSLRKGDQARPFMNITIMTTQNIANATRRAIHGTISQPPIAPIALPATSRSIPRPDRGDPATG